MNLFQQLSPEEEVRFKQWAHDNYTPFTEISPIWHPVIQKECVKINQEKRMQTEATTQALKPSLLGP